MRVHFIKEHVAAVVEETWHRGGGKTTNIVKSVTVLEYLPELKADQVLIDKLETKKIFILQPMRKRPKYYLL